ncbi:hypothetical protein BOTBODRAFT_436133 [Botryobasidium botryosum FD-172 SS1]|uniref:Formin GTPase-binding domain-containing protein n=1 Tax=Botryobasidium botryosum (strain FD-172 SS1) TaxID=930990 RepID=A0A067MUT7_BOTB1|nr:hypothetical protein BOTBODRAFT_436133 [Botryobasidium botryosum FD-172 SS1]
MFKGILPGTSRRASTAEVGERNPASGKENRPTVGGDQIQRNGVAQRSGGTAIHTRANSDDGVKGSHDMIETGATHWAFEKMLDDLQIPSTIRPKLQTLETPVKAAMLRSSQTLNALDPATTSPPPPPRAIRKISSSGSIDTYDPTPSHEFEYVKPIPMLKRRGSCQNISFEMVGPPHFLAHHRGVSVDLPLSTSNLVLPYAPWAESTASVATVTNGHSSGIKGKGKDKERDKDKDAPMKMALMMAGTKSTELDVEKVKKLRILLRNEAASWSEQFLKHGGYSALLNRLTDLLEVEWREEQHDDQVLYELLRCFKALSTSSIGCFALRSLCPTPFASLVSLLYSDKKPGDLASRHLIVDLLIILFDLYPADGGPARSGSGVGVRPTTPYANPGAPIPAPHDNLYSLVRALLLTPRPAPSESLSVPISPHAFIASLHQPRIFKTYLRELSDICRDYFWVFCHPQNTIWSLAETDEEKVERPRAPGGMTGGVEFEAMAYLTIHLRLVNLLCTSAADLDLPAENDMSAHKLHSDLFVSGFERILVTVRKASTTYYPTLHLELARYVSLAVHAQYEIPWTLSRYIGPPPATLQKAPQIPRRPRTTKSEGATRESVAERSRSPPSLPPTPQMDALRMH